MRDTGSRVRVANKKKGEEVQPKKKVCPQDLQDSGKSLFGADTTHSGPRGRGAIGLSGRSRGESIIRKRLNKSSVTVLDEGEL